ADETRSEALRAAAARRLARLARPAGAGGPGGADGRPLAAADGSATPGRARPVPAADPASWWGTRALSTAPVPIRSTESALSFSASALTAINECPARWFLEREAGGEQSATQAQGFGNAVHAVADRIGRGEIDLTDPSATVARLLAEVDRVWGHLPFRTPWSKDRERAQLVDALHRFIDWHRRPDARELLATEQPFRVAVTLPDATDVVLQGYADRLELDGAGRVVVIDLKTGKYPASDLPNHPQLGLYQFAVEQGAMTQVHESTTSGGAELWQLRQEARGARLKVQRQEVQAPDASGIRPIEHQLMAAAAVLGAERFPARPGSYCERCDFSPLCPAQNAGTVLS
ncbi:MAG: RecB family exonuclease, partial [Nocardioides sp.]